MHRSASGGRRRRARRAPRRTPLGTALGLLGELLVTAGALVLLYVGYVLWGTGIQTGIAQDELREQTVGTWAEPQAGTVTGATGEEEPEAEAEPHQALEDVQPGEGYALLRIPRLGADWEWVVVEGTDLSHLADGPGHYADSAHPGELGNLAIAGHRSGHGAPFHELDRLRAGDTLEIETSDGVWTYTVDEPPTVIEPTDVWVVDPVPGEPASAEPTERRITLTTCHPRYGSSQRMYVSGVLSSGEEV